jgi:hypothetical protein
VADTDDEALAATRDAHGRWYRSITKLWHDHDGHSPDGLFAWETATQHETILFGSPARVREQLPRLLEVSGCNYVIGAFAWGTLTAAQTRRSLRLFAEEVMPAFTESTAPVASGPGLVNLSHRLYNSGLVCDICLMNTPGLPNHYKHHRFPIEIISHAVWLYFRFCLSYRDVEELLFARGVTVTYEAIRKWCRKFGQPYANALRHGRPKPGDTWHLDEVFLTINGKRSYLWRAVDQEGNILDILVQRWRDKNAAKTFFRKLLKGLTYVPRVIVPISSKAMVRRCASSCLA